MRVILQSFLDWLGTSASSNGIWCLLWKGRFVRACDIFKECESLMSERTSVPSCCVLDSDISKDGLLSHIWNTHIIVPTETLEYLSNHFSWLSWSLWEYGIITYYRVLWDTNNVQFLPVPCIISSEIVLLFLLHTLMHGKLNTFFEKKHLKNKPIALNQAS